MSKYYRLVTVSYQDFEDWLNLPYGFEVDSIENDIESAGLSVRIKCPNTPAYIHHGNVILRISGDSNKRIPVWSWPELEGQDL